MGLFKLLVTLSMLFSFGAMAQERWEIGVAGGSSHVLSGESFKNSASTGNGQTYWLGYSLDNNWGVELGSDYVDFDSINSKHQFVNLSGVYRFAVENWIHPVAKLGLTSVVSKSATDVATNSMPGLKAAVGFEADWKYISLGGLLNYYHVAKSDDALDYKNSQMMVPAVFVAFHSGLESDEPEASKPEAPAQVVAKKDTDGDGVVDEDDKCPETPAGVAVNSIGCSEKEKASVKLNVEFASGKSLLESSYDGEVTALANFMKKYPETKVEIAGHTDNVGAAKANQTLSQKRADAVKAALIKAGVEESRVTAKGYGSSQPIADNKTADGRKMNRRVMAELSVTTDKKK